MSLIIFIFNIILYTLASYMQLDLVTHKLTEQVCTSTALRITSPKCTECIEIMVSTENTKKIIVIGDGVVGKTCLVAKLTEGKFINNYRVTIGVEYGVKTFVREGKEIRLCLWDIAGQDPFRGLMPQYARRSEGAIVMCDVTRAETMEEGATLWKKAVDDSVCLSNGQHIPCVLLINKYDRPKAQHQISQDRAFEFARDNGFVKYFETSVKDGTNISEALEYLVDVIMAYEEDGQMISSAYQDGIKLSATYNRAKKQNNGCCGLFSDDDELRK